MPRSSAEIPDTNVEEPHIEPEPEPVAVEPEPAPVTVEPEPVPEPELAPVEVEPEPEPVAVALMSADAALSAEIPDTSVEEPHDRAGAGRRCVRVGGYRASSAEIPDASVGEGPVAVTADAPVAPRRRLRTVDIVTLLGAAALLVNLVAVQSNVYNGYGSVFFGGVIEDFDFWIAPLALAVGLVIVRLRPGAGYEWLIGAASSFVLLDIGTNLVFLANESDVSDGFPILRLVAGAARHWRRRPEPGARRRCRARASTWCWGASWRGCGLRGSGMRDFGRYIGYPAVHVAGPRDWWSSCWCGASPSPPGRPERRPSWRVAWWASSPECPKASGTTGTSWTRSSFSSPASPLITVVGILRWRQSELAET